MGMESIFGIRAAEEAGYYARALGHAIFTEAETWEELRRNVLEASSLHFGAATVRGGGGSSRAVIAQVMKPAQRLTAIIQREDDGFVALCPELTSRVGALRSRRLDPI